MTGEPHDEEAHDGVRRDGERRNVEGLPDRVLALEIAGLASRMNDAQHRLLVLVAEFDHRSAWLATGATSCAVWLAEVCDIDPATAREHVRVARALAMLPVISAAFAAGVLSYAKVRTLTRVARPDTETELVQLAGRYSASELTKAIAVWAEGHLDPADLAARHHEARSVSWRVDIDGMVVITARLAPDTAAVVTATIDTLVARGVRTDTHTRDGHNGDNHCVSRHAPAGASLGQQRADALLAALTNGGHQINVEVLINIGVRDDGTIWACLPDGTPVPGPGYSHLYDGAFIRLLLRDIDGTPIDATNRRRHPTTRQRRLIEARATYQCEQPGCRARHFLDVHHTIPYAESHHTVTAESTLRCGLHHRRIHDPVRSSS